MNSLTGLPRLLRACLRQPGALGQEVTRAMEIQPYAMVLASWSRSSKSKRISSKKKRRGRPFNVHEIIPERDLVIHVVTRRSLESVENFPPSPEIMVWRGSKRGGGREAGTREAGTREAGTREAGARGEGTREVGARGAGTR